MKKRSICLLLFVCLGITQLFADTASNDRKYSGFVNTRLDRIEYNINEGNLSAAQSDMANAEKYLGKISDEYKSGDGAEMVARLNRLKGELGSVTVAAEGAADQEREFKRQESQFRNLSGMDSFIEAYYAVEDGKRGNFRNLDLDDLDRIKDQMALLKAYGPTFKEKYAMLIEKEPDFEALGGSYSTTVASMLDVFDHSDECLAMLEEGAFSKAATELLDVLKGGLEDVKEKGMLSIGILGRIYSDNYEEYGEYLELKGAYEKAGKRMPRAMEDEIESLISQIKEGMINGAKKNRWKGSDYPYSTSDMSRCVQNEHPSARLAVDDIKHVGAIPENQWTVYKNALGTVLYESGQGYAIYSVDGISLPFDVGVTVIFSKPFDGKNFRECNDISYSLYYTPFKK